MSKKIYQKKSNQPDSAYILVDTVSEEVTNDITAGLEPGTEYTFKIVRELPGYRVSAPRFVTFTTQGEPQEEIPNVSPAVSLAIDDNSITTAEQAILTATPTDSDGTISKVEFYRGATLIGTVNSAPYVQTVNGLAVGSYSFTAKAYDNNNASTVSNAVSLDVATPEDTAGYTAPITGNYTFTDTDFNASATSVQSPIYNWRNSASYVDIRHYTGNSLPVVLLSNAVGNPNYGRVFFLVNGVLHQHYVVQANLQYEIYNLPLPAGTKEVRLLNSGPNAMMGAMIQGVNIPEGESIRIKIPTVPANKEVFYGDSLTSGYNATNPSLDSHAALRRARLNGSVFVQIDAIGGRQLVTDTQQQATDLANNLSTQLNGTAGNKLVLFLGTNDDNNTNLTVAGWETRVNNFLDAMHTVRPGLPIYIVTLLKEDTQRRVDFSNVLQAAADARVNVWAIEGTQLMLPYNAGDWADAVHPNSQGHIKLEANLYAALNAISGDSVTPAAPVITADDTANTLSASHVLGTSEILYSENGGAFSQYNGDVINVGDVERAAGYWQFKTKAATNRNESAISNSPAFTIAAVDPNLEANAYKTMVESGGGTVTDFEYVKSALSFLKANNLYNDLASLLSPSMGIIKEVDNKARVLFSAAKSYSLSGPHLDQTDTAKQPLFTPTGLGSRPSITTTPTANAFTWADLPASQQYSFVIVGKRKAGSSGKMLMSIGTDTTKVQAIWNNGGGNLGYCTANNDCLGVSGVASWIDNPFVLGLDFVGNTPSSFKMYKGGLPQAVSQITGTPLARPNDPFLNYGSYVPSGPTFNWDGECGDTWAFSRILTASEHALVADFIKIYYGIA